MKKITSVFFLTVFIFASCSRRPSVQPESALPVNSEGRITIGFSIDTFVIERWRRDVDIFTSVAQNAGAEVIVQTAGNSAENQIKQIQYLLDRNVNVLVIVPKEAESLQDVLKTAKLRGIPVISYDRLIRNADISLYITIDSEKVGVLMAQGLADKIRAGKYLCIYGPKEDYNMLMATKGVHSVLSHYSGIEVLAEFYTDNWNYDLAYRAANDFFDKGMIPDAVICGNDAIAEFVLRSLAEHRLSDVAVSGQDSDIAACQRVVDGTQAMTVYKPIQALAKEAAENAVSIAKYGKSVPEHQGNKIERSMNNGFKDVPAIMLEPKTVTKENIDSIIIDSGFHSHPDVYRTK